MTLGSVLLLAALPSPNLQVGRVFPTIDAIVANCASVHIGEIQSLEFSEPGDGFRTIDVKVKVKVLKNLKGPKAEVIELGFPTRFTEKILRSIMKEKSQFLFLSPAENDSLRDNIFRKMVGVNQVTKLPYHWFRIYEPQAMDRYVDFDSNLFTADLRVVSNMGDLLKEARRAAKVYPQVVEVTGFALPNSVIEMCGPPNAYGYFVTPRSDALKTLAQKLHDDPAKAIADARKKSKRVYKEPKPTPDDLERLRELGAKLLKDPPPNAIRLAGPAAVRRNLRSDS